MEMDEDDNPHRKMIPKASGVPSTEFSNASKLAIYHAKLILGSYRADQAADPDIYVTAITLLLSRYPPDIGARLTDPKDGVAGKYKWLPTVSEVKEEAEAILEAERQANYRADQLRKQWQLRDQVEREAKAETPEHRAKVVERVKNEMRAHGFKFAGDDRIKPVETPETVKAKFGLSDEQWKSLPDAPPAGEFNNLMENHAKRDNRNPAIIRAEEEAEWRDHMANR
jgi:hypothetical protein